MMIVVTDTATDERTNDDIVRDDRTDGSTDVVVVADDIRDDVIDGFIEVVTEDIPYDLTDGFLEVVTDDDDETDYKPEEENAHFQYSFSGDILLLEQLGGFGGIYNATATTMIDDDDDDVRSGDRQLAVIDDVSGSEDELDVDDYDYVLIDDSFAYDEYIDGPDYAAVEFDRDGVIIASAGQDDVPRHGYIAETTGDDSMGEDTNSDDGEERRVGFNSGYDDEEDKDGKTTTGPANVAGFGVVLALANLLFVWLNAMFVEKALSLFGR